MSKKRIQNRLEELFAPLDQANSMPSAKNQSKMPGWTWTVDSDYRYVSISNEVTECLGFQAHRFMGQSLYSFAIAPQSAPRLKKALEANDFPVEVDVFFNSTEGAFVPVHLHIEKAGTSEGIDGVNGRTLLIQENQQLQSPTSSDNEKQIIPESIEIIDPTPINPILDRNQFDPFLNGKLSSPSSIETPSQLESIESDEIDPNSSKSPTRVDDHSVHAIDFNKEEKKKETPPLLTEKISAEVIVEEDKSDKLTNTQIDYELNEKETRPKNLDPEKTKEDPNKSPLATPQSQPRFSSTPSPRILSKTGTLRPVVSSTKSLPALVGEPWTPEARLSLENRNPIIKHGTADSPAIFAIPLKIRNEDSGVIEILDERESRFWNEDDKQMVQEITTQLGLALENAQLYAAIQQELRDRIRAEEEILRRNEELAALNQVGQKLGKLASSGEIFQLAYTTIGELFIHRNVTIAVLDEASQSINFPIHSEEGQIIHLPNQKLGNGVIEHVLDRRIPLLINESALRNFENLGIEPPNQLPASLIAVPLVAGERPIGVIILQEKFRENAFNQIQVDLLSTIALQVANALENARLFEEIRNALESIENRERYQANIARAVAILTEFGTRSLPNVLEILAQAVRCSRIYFAEVEEDTRGAYWRAVADWNNLEIAESGDRIKIQSMPVALFPEWIKQLREKNYAICSVNEISGQEQDFMESQQIGSTLLIAVPGKTNTPNFLAFDQMKSIRIWQNEEINVLRVIADALSNTMVREDLLDQLQASLDESENLYKASHRLALANTFDEMIAAITSGVNVPAINRGVLVLFDYDNSGKLSKMNITSTWHSGVGSVPPGTGADYKRALYERLFVRPTPLFLDDIQASQIDGPIKDMLMQQSVRSMAVLPLWAGKHQSGVLLLQSEERHRFSGKELRAFPPLADQMATTVENQQLFAQTQEALAETELLYKLTNSIAQANNSQDLAYMISQNVMPKAASRVTLITVFHGVGEEPSELEIVGLYDLNGETQLPTSRIPAPQLPAIRVLGTEALVVPDINQSSLIDEITRKTLENLSITGGACFIPLRSAGKLIGIIIASSRRTVDFDTEEIRLLQIVGNGIAVALERQRLLLEAERRALELRTAAEIARDTASTLTLDILLDRIVSQLVERFQFYHAAIFLKDATGKNAIVREASGAAGKDMKDRGHRIEEGSKTIIGNALASGECIVINDVSRSAFYAPHPLLPDTQSEAGVPLKIQDHVIGVLDIQSELPNAFGPDEISVLEILADQITVAITNAESYELSQKAIVDMREADRVKSQFLANMSHELRTPLNSIIGFSRVIIKGIDGPVNDTQKQDLTAIYNSGQHLLTLINEILDLSKIEAGKMELQLGEMDISELITGAIPTATGFIKDKPIQIKQEVESNLPTVPGDQTRISQVLINLLSNAAKFTEKGEVTIAANKSASATGRPEIMVTVTDTGPGVAAKDQAKLFLPFSQVDDSPTRKTGGTGLGLSICRSLVELHNGRIGLLWSEVGKGSCFYFTLPIKVKDETAPLPTISEIEQPSENIEPLATILSIDDDPRILDLYQRYLTPQGYRVVPLSDPKKAVIRAKEVKPFAITLDVMMPEKDGWMVMRDLKEDPETRNIPVIMCSIIEDEEKGFNLGAADYLTKPFLQEELISAINRISQSTGQVKVLLVDDDDEDLRLLEKMLGDDEKYLIVKASSGPEALRLITSESPDAVVLDLFMPEMDGFDLISSIRVGMNLKDLPLIILSGADLSPEQHQLLSEFGQNLLTKASLKDKELLKTLENALRKYHP